LANNNIEELLLSWTGHPLVDVGIATLCALVNKESPEDLTLEDLDRAADEMAEYYFSGLMSSYSANVFTMNAYDNPTSSVTTKKEYENRVLRAHRSAKDDAITIEHCVFSGKPATHLIERRQMPLLTGENVLNFYPAGRGALPVAGPYLIALQALPLGGRKVEGKLLVAHSDEPELTLAFCQHYLADNRRVLGLAQAGQLPKHNGPSEILIREQGAWDSSKKRPKYPDAKAPTTLITSELMDILQNKFRSNPSTMTASVSAYWINNGQTPSLEIFHLPGQVVRFLFMAGMAPYGSNWRNLVNQGWRELGKHETRGSEEGVKKKKTTKKGINITGGPGRSRNIVLADLFAIYEQGFVDLVAARSFVQRHLLQRTSEALKKVKEPSVSIDLENGLNFELINWPLTGLFLKEVMQVEEKQINNIKCFADRLADYIERNNDKSFFNSLVYAKNSWDMRGALMKAQRNQAKNRNELLFGLQDYLDVFQADDAVGRLDWSLTRDLISIRLIEQLHGRGFFSREDNSELLTETEVAPE
jgi:CRISPR-associated protein Cst1